MSHYVSKYQSIGTGRIIVKSVDKTSLVDDTCVGKISDNVTGHLVSINWPNLKHSLPYLRK